MELRVGPEHHPPAGDGLVHLPGLGVHLSQTGPRLQGEPRVARLDHAPQDGPGALLVAEFAGELRLLISASSRISGR